HGYDAAASVADIKRVVKDGPFTTSADTEVGANGVDVVVGAVTDINVDDLLEIGDQLNGELRFVRTVTQIDATHLHVVTDSALELAYKAGTNVTILDPQPPGPGEQVENGALQDAARTGDSVVLLTTPPTNFTDRTQLVIFDVTKPATRQARRIGRLGQLSLTTPITQSFQTSTTVEAVTLADNEPAGTHLLDANAAAGTNIIRLNNRVGLGLGNVLRIGAAPDQEFATIVSLPNPSPGGAPPNAGNVVLRE